MMVHYLTVDMVEPTLLHCTVTVGGQLGSEERCKRLAFVCRCHFCQSRTSNWLVSVIKLISLQRRSCESKTSLN